MARSRLSIIRNFNSAFAYGLIGASLVASSARAADLTWNGLYRVEGVEVQDSEMNSQNTNKGYALHHLILEPKLVAADGLIIHSRLDILNNSTYGINQAGGVHSVAGDLFGGSGPGNAAPAGGPISGSDSNAWGLTESAGNIAVTELYASWSQEFGQLLIGRTPLDFGLGLSWSAGEGEFDHYITTKDLVAYRLVIGNFYVQPIVAKTSEGALNTMADVNDYVLQAGYDNPESELKIGAMYNLHVVTGNDSPVYQSQYDYQTGTAGQFENQNSYPGGIGATRTGSFKNTLMAFYFSEKPTAQFRASAEFDLNQGDTGLQTSSTNASTPNAGVGLNAFGVAVELEWLPHPDSGWFGNLKLGMATGDDPGTDNTDEGFHFNRNYHVAMLMFRQPLGAVDMFRSGMIRPTGSEASTQIDDEAISNAMYLAPTLDYQARENLSFGLTVLYARLNKDPIAPTNGNSNGTSMDLGEEVDVNVTWKPMERLTWLSGLGVLIPGQAWTAGNLNLENRMVYGLETKAAISF